jgi:hypothetical protein
MMNIRTGGEGTLAWIFTFILALHCASQFPNWVQTDHPHSGISILGADFTLAYPLTLEQRVKTDRYHVIQLSCATDAGAIDAGITTTRREIQRMMRSHVCPLQLCLVSTQILSTSL